MSSRPRSLRANRLPRKRTLRPRLEDLEIRLVLSTQDFTASPTYVVYNPPPGVTESELPAVGGIPGAPASSVTPGEMREYYGLSTSSGAPNVFFGSTAGEGQGQTIAIVDAYDDPGFVNSTAANFNSSDLARFDQYYGLPNPPSFMKVGQTGSTTTLPSTDPTGDAEIEESLDVEWAHVMAPLANIVLVEADSLSYADLLAAETVAADLPGVSVVSNSWSGPEYPNEQQMAAAFTTPSGHQGVTFLASTGDSGSTGQSGVDPFAGPPADLPGVVAVGGTSLLVQNGSPTMETAWNQGGGGVSRFEQEPAYQDAVQSTGYRTTPDVSIDADPDFGGVAVYDTYSFGSADPWEQIGGTSLACPMWAALIAIADQGRVAAGGTTLDGASQTLPALYSLPSYDFNDIVSGNNEGHGAVPGYDEVTGLGSPRANLLLPDLAAYGLAEAPFSVGQLKVTTQPPGSVTAGSSFGLSVAVTDSFADVDTDYNGSITLTLTPPPGGSSLAAVTMTAVNGVAVFDGLSLSAIDAGYRFTASAAGLAPVTTSSFNVVGDPAPGTETLYPAPSYGSLAAALSKAATDSASNITIQLQSGIYALNLGGGAGSPLVIQNSNGTNVPIKTITIVGAGEGSTIIEPSQDQGWSSSIFEIIGTSSAQVHLTIQGLTIEGGEATGGGVLGLDAAVGGGLLVDGAKVTLDEVALEHDAAVGKPGSHGSAAARKRQGGSGGAGESAAGGGLYVASGTVKLTDVTFQDNFAWGGQGGTGGTGGTDGGRGGPGGFGGSATGGGAYVAGGVVTGSKNSFTSDAAVGGVGGYGGRGGLGGTPQGLGAGGGGGLAGMAFGGGLFVGGGTVTLGSTPISHDLALGGAAGTGGIGGYSHTIKYGTGTSSTPSSGSTSYPSYIGRGGAPGTPGDAAGGGVYVGGGSLTLNGGEAGSNIASDRAIGGFVGASSGDFRIFDFATAAQRGATRDPHGPVNPAPPQASGGHHGGGNGSTAISRVGQHPIGKPQRIGAHADAGTSSGSSGSVAIGQANGGGLYIAGGSVHLYSQNVSNDLANYGGGIYVSRAGALAASGLTMTNDNAEVGGAMVNYGKVSIANGVITSNEAAPGFDNLSISGYNFVGARGSTGGAIANYGRLGFSNVTVSNNNARFGGGIYSRSGAVKATVLNLDNNTAITRGGGIYSIKGALTIHGLGSSSISGNLVEATGSSLSVAVGSGGGIDLKSGTATITGVNISGNEARAGGGIYIASGSVILGGTDFTNNVARQYGGGVYNLGTVSASGGTFASNSAMFNGGGIDNFASLSIRNATLSGNSAGDDGGAINNPASMTLYNDVFSENLAGDLGGAIDNGGVLNAQSTTLTENSANEGGGVFNVGSATLPTNTKVPANGPVPQIDAVTQNFAAVSGGGIYEGSGGQVKATGLSITGNTALEGSGGGIYDRRGSLSIVGGEISTNTAAANGPGVGLGGGLYDSGGKVTLSANKVEDNTSNYGAGLYINAGSVSLVGETLDHNTAVQAGGGIWNLGTLTLSTTTLTLNVAKESGGGGIENSGKLSITDSTLSQNTALGGTGGDLDNGAAGTVTIGSSTLTAGHASSGGDAANAGSLTISTSTLSFGSAASKGGGLADLGAGTVRLSNATIADNTSVGKGGGIDTQGTLIVVNATIAYNQGGGNGAGLSVDSGTTSLVNTIVDLDTGGTDLAGSLSSSSSNNLFGTFLTTPAGSNNQLGVTQPDLGQLANNGGLTETIALLPNSPAIDKGSNALALDPSTNKPLTTDQRGALRGALGLNAGSTVDIGAFEASSSYMVTSTADSLTIGGTLRSALDWAEGSFNYNQENISDPAPNTIVFDVSGTFAIPETITLVQPLNQMVSQVDPLGKLGTVPIEIQGPGNGVVTVSGGGVYQVFNIAANSQVILQGITVADGSAAQGGGVENLGTLTLNNTVLMGNKAASGGGVYSSESLTVDGGTFEDNVASSGDGGGLDVGGGGVVSISQASFMGNSAVAGGGIYATPATLTIDDIALTENSASTYGGGLADLASVGSSIVGGTIAGNSAANGGGLEIDGANATITGTTLSGNWAIAAGPDTGEGGAIFYLSNPGTLAASALSLSNNSAANGGAIYASGNLTLTASTLSANSADFGGGGVDNAGTLTVEATTLLANSAASGGGIASDGMLTVTGSTLSSNSAASGGGIYDSGGLDDVITNATVADNSALNGGGIYSNSSALSLINSTLAYNAVVSGGTGAGLDVASGLVVMYNTIVAANTGTGSTNVAGSTTGSNDLETTSNPGLASGLANNGGPTQTIALTAGSLAIDTGINSVAGVDIPTTDQRGAVRGGPGGGLNAGANVDIGAYEASSEYLVTQSPDTKDLGTFRTAVSWANISTNANPANLANPAPNTIEFDTSPTGVFKTSQTIALSAALGTLVLSNTATAEAIDAPTTSDVTLSGGNAVGVLQVDAGVNATVSNLAITGGSAAAGAGINNAGILTIAGGSVSSNSATGSGGGIDNTGTLNLSGTQLGGNSAGASGGGIYNTGTLTLAAGTTISDNQAALAGGGIYDAGKLTLTSGTFSGNSATTGGGVAVGGTLTDTASTFTGNAATTGGGLAIQKGGVASLTGTTVTGNTAGSASVTGSGGGIDNAGKLTLFQVTIGQSGAGNTSTGEGGGIDNESGGSLTASYSTVANNVAQAQGGGLDNTGTATVSVTTLASDTAGTTGGAIGNEIGGNLTLSDDTLASSSATTGGGGLGNAGTASVTNATIADNQGGRGGGVYDTGVLTVNNATIAYNSVGAGGTAGGLDAANGLTILYNTIVAQNFSGAGSASDAAGSLSAISAYNLFGTGGSGGLTALNGNLVSIKNPGLGQLAPLTGPGSNGGPTQTIALLAGSPAIDAGSASIPGASTPVVDQRGALRGPAGLDAGSAPDIGAYEASSSYQVNTTADSNLMGTLREAIAWANVSTNANPANLAPNATAPNTAVFDTGGVFSKPQTITISPTLGPIVLSDSNPGGESIDGTASNGLTISGGYQLQLMSWGNGSGVPTSGQNLVIAGLDNSQLLHIRVFDAAGVRTDTYEEMEGGTLYLVSANASGTVVSDMPESSLPAAQAQAIASLKQQLPGLLPPNVLTPAVDAQVLCEATLIVGQTLSGQVFSVSPAATAILTGLTIIGGSAPGGASAPASGGAISNQGNLTISDSSLTGNSAAAGGGAIDNLSTLNLVSSTLSGNIAGQYGGAIDVESAGTLTITNSTIAENTSGQGGGIYSMGTLTTINDTLAYNTATTTASGGGLNVGSGSAILYNTIVASNSDTAGGGSTADDIAGQVSSASNYNLIGSGGSGGLTDNYTTPANGGNIVLSAGQSPGLAPGLANNGGPTQTIALTVSPTQSPAIGSIPSTAAQTVVYDQRGALRNTPDFDIGAYEFSSSYLVTSAQDSTVPGTLRSAIAWADAATGVVSTLPLQIEFDTQHLFATPQVINLSLGTLALTNTSRPIEIQGPGASMVTINGSGNGTSGAFSVAAGVSVQISGITVAGGVAAAGGAIENAGSLAVSDSAFTGNATTPQGSGAAINNTGTLVVSGSSFSDNTGSYYGGAIYNQDGTATISGSNFVGNATQYGLGGAIDNFGGTLTVTGGTFQGNTAFQGGAIYNRNDTTNNLAGTATLSGVTITGNSAYQGGGLFNEGTLAVSSSTIANDTAFQGGAASNNFGGTMTLTDSTLAFNSAQQYGGAIDSVSTLTVVSSTIAYNTVSSGGSGGGIDVYAGTTALYDTIAALNTVGAGKSGAANDIVGQVAPSSAYNLIGTGGLTNRVNSNIVGTTNPGLAPALANNGGPTETIALYVGSPAIGAGSATITGVTIPTTDQRGIARPATGYDIGAFQGSIPVPTPAPTPTPVPTPTPSAVPAATSDMLVAAATSSLDPGSGTSAALPLVHGHSPFHGRTLNSKGRHQAKTSHAAAGGHQSARAASPAQKTVRIRIAKHR